MFSTILGWVLVILGVASYGVALAILVKEQFFKEAEKALLPAGVSDDIKALGEFLGKLATAIEEFSKLSVPVQWAFLGLVNIGMGVYLVANTPI